MSFWVFPRRQQAKEGKLDVKHIDPQKIFEADALLKSIEDNHLEDEFEGFDRLKNAGQTYHDIRQLRETLQSLQVFFLEEKIATGKRLINHYSAWLANVRKAVAQKNKKVPSAAEIKTVEDGIKAYEEEVALHEMQLKALQPSALN